MSNNQNLLNAVLLQFRGKALEAYSAIEVLLQNPSDAGVVEDIVRHTKRLVEYETMTNTLQKYFVPNPAPPQPKKPSNESKVVKPESSSSHTKPIDIYRKSIEAQKVRDVQEEKI
jgi:hypothetical protein